MKLVSVIGLMLLMAAATVSAQSPVKFGIKAGANMASMTGDGWDTFEAMEDGLAVEKKSRMGLAGGLFVNLSLGTGVVSLQPEFLYVIKGAKADMTMDGETVTMKLKNTYIEVPVLIKYNFTSAGSASPFMFVGPVATFNAGCQVEYADVPAGAEDFFEDEDVENAKSMDFGVTIGGGLGLAVGPSGKLTFDLRYTMGLGQVFEDVAAAEQDSGKLYLVDDDGKALDFKNSDIRLMAGFQF